MTPDTQDLVACLTSQIEYAEKAARQDATAPSHEAAFKWLRLASELRRERAKLTGSL